MGALLRLKRPKESARETIERESFFSLFPKGRIHFPCLKAACCILLYENYISVLAMPCRHAAASFVCKYAKEFLRGRSDGVCEHT